ncbi:MAG: DnaA N-terminal domain-containing protein [Anaerolineae bacterium]|nr:DnaA N-terminal domain-containing protein [Anaerolineae bacterium]
MTSFWTSDVLPQLRQQMTRATFETWLSDTRQVGEIDDDVLTIGVASAYAKDWIEHRLSDTIRRTASSLAGQALALKVIINQTSADPAPPATGENGHGPNLSPPPAPGEIAVELISFDPTQRGFVMTSNYAVRFWQPYLNTLQAKVSPFTLWQTIKAFAYDSNRDAWPSIQTLADICAGGQRYKILGRAERKGCRRIVGALEVLEQQRIVYVKRVGSGSKTSYTFRILDNLPLLTPRQIENLPKPLRLAHKRFIKRSELDYEEWEQMTLPSLTLNDEN